MAAIIAGAFFMGSYALERFISVNKFLLGLMAAALVTVAIQPLQRFSERLADRLLPGVARSETYLSERRHEVYRNAVEAAALDGTITERERAILTKLQESLEVSAAEAISIENDVQRALSANSQTVLSAAAPA